MGMQSVKVGDAIGMNAVVHILAMHVVHAVNPHVCILMLLNHPAGRSIVLCP